MDYKQCDEICGLLARIAEALEGIDDSLVAVVEALENDGQDSV